MKQFILQEGFASVQEAQAGITRLFKKASKEGKFYRIMRNQEPLGILVPNKMWIGLVEQLDGLPSIYK